MTTENEFYKGTLEEIQNYIDYVDQERGLGKSGKTTKTWGKPVPHPREDGVYRVLVKKSIPSQENLSLVEDLESWRPEKEGYGDEEV